MTHTPDTSHTQGKRVSTVVDPSHPLDPLSANEISTVRDVLVAAGLLKDQVRMAMLLPLDPDKKTVAKWTPGTPFERRALATLWASRGADGRVLRGWRHRQG